MTIKQLIENGTISLDTEVLGELVLTSDKKLVGHGSDIWVKGYYGNHTCFTVILAEKDYPELSIRPASVCWGGPDNGAERISDCYSSRQACS